MNVADLSDKVAADAGISKPVAKLAIDAAFKHIIETLQAGSEISVPSFGKFKVKDTPARQARNPKTGEAVAVPASRKLVFSPAKRMKEVLAA